MKPVHPSYIKAAKLAILYIPLSLFNFSYSKLSLFTTKGLAIAVFMILVLLGIRHLLLRGVAWIKYLLLLFLVTGLLKTKQWFDFGEWGNLFVTNQSAFWCRIASTLLSGYIVYLLFSADKPWKTRKTQRGFKL